MSHRPMSKRTSQSADVDFYGSPRRSMLVGGLVAAGLGVLATLVANALDRVGIGFVSAVFVAILLGIAMRATLGLPNSWEVGIEFAAKRVLQVAVILLGFRFSIGSVLSTGWSALAVIMAVIVTAFAATGLLMRAIKIDRKLGLLIAVGTAICGNSAIAATAPIVDADDEDISFASAVITLFGTAAMLVYPFIGRLMGLSPEEFGFLAGAGVHDSAQAVASGFIYSDVAGGVATVVKLTRTGFLVPIVIVLGFVARKRTAASGGPTITILPLFALGFVVASLLRTLGDALLGDAQMWERALDIVARAASFLLVTAMAAVGAKTHIEGLRRIGFAPFAIGMTASLVAALAALVVTLIVR